MVLDRLDEARKVAESARAHGIDGARIHQRFLEMAYIEGDQAAVAKEIQWYAGRPEEYLSLGSRRESSKLYKRAAETALQRKTTRHYISFTLKEFGISDEMYQAVLQSPLTRSIAFDRPTWDCKRCSRCQLQ
jgi:hypothetical protein